MHSSCSELILIYSLYFCGAVQFFLTWEQLGLCFLAPLLIISRPHIAPVEVSVSANLTRMSSNVIIQWFTIISMMLKWWDLTSRSVLNSLSRICRAPVFWTRRFGLNMLMMIQVMMMKPGLVFEEQAPCFASWSSRRGRARHRAHQTQSDCSHSPGWNCDHDNGI